MRNLLTPQLKKRLKAEYRLRLLTVALLLLTLVLFMGGVFLVPSLLLSETRKASSEEKARLVEQGLARHEEAALTSILQRARAELDVVTLLRARPFISESVEEILENKPANIRMVSFSFLAVEKSSRSIAISGVARSREDLLLFEQTLKKNPRFSSVVLPVSNLAKDKDIAFSITINQSL